jgi:hypothetical protein
MGFDLVAQSEVGAGIAASGLVELFAEGGHRLGAPRGSERVEPDEQLAGAGVDVAGGLMSVRIRRCPGGRAGGGSPRSTSWMWWRSMTRRRRVRRAPWPPSQGVYGEIARTRTFKHRGQRAGKNE